MKSLMVGLFFTLDAMHVIAKGSHSIKSGARPANVDPWYEEFHRPLLDDLLQVSSCVIQVEI